MNNYPPGISDSTYGAPWNNVEEEREVTITLSASIVASFQGPDKITEEQILEAIKEIVQRDLSITTELYTVVDVSYP